MEGGGFAMSTQVDNRVVKMTFDNEQFERGIKNTKKTLEDFEKALKLDGATAGFDALKAATDKVNLSALGDKAKTEASRIDSASTEAMKSIDKIDDSASNADFSDLGKAANNAVMDVNDAASNVNLSGITNGTEEASSGFNALEVVATGALFSIGESISDLITGGLASLGNKIKEYTIDPIAEGFGEYETQIGSIQTILANTGRGFDNQDAIDEVNTALDQLNTYADKTIYNFTDMTQAIGSFTSAGLGRENLQEAVDAVQGVANVAALAGATASDVHRVLPQLAQALSSGAVTQQDWMSIQTAHMDSKIFVDTIADVAMHMAQAGKAEQAAYEAGNAILNQGVTMRSALNKIDYKEWAGWFSSDILSNALQLFTYDWKEMTADEIEDAKNYFRSLGYTTEDEFTKIFEQAELAQRAAKEVKTWSQLWDTIGEAIGSNWAGVWRNLIGDFKQATDTFTFLSDSISTGIDGLFSGIVNAAKIFNKSGAIDIIFGGFFRNEKGEKELDNLTNGFKRVEGAIDYLVQAIAKPLGAIKEAFDNVFGMTDDQLGLTITSFALAFKDFAQSLVISDNAAMGLRQIFEGVFSILDIGLTIVLDLGAAFFGLVGIIRTFTDPLVDIALVLVGQIGQAIKWIHDKFLDLRAAAVELVYPFIDLIGVIEEIVKGFFGFVDIPNQIQSIGDTIKNVLDMFWNFIDIPGIFRVIADAIRSVFGFIGDLTGWNKAVEESNNLLNTTGEEVSAVDIWIQNLLKNPIIAFFKGIMDAILGLLPSIAGLTDGLNKVDEEGRKITLASIFRTIADVIHSILTPLSQIVLIIGKGLLSAIGLIFNLVTAIGGFALKLKDAFLAWEPIKNVIDMLNRFKDGAINFFLSLPEKLTRVSDGISNPLGIIQRVFGGVIDWFQGVTEYFGNITVEQFITDVKNWANGVIESVKGVFEYFSNVSPEQMVDDFVNNVYIGIQNGFGNLIGIAKHLDGIFPSLNGVFENGLNNIKNTLFSWLSGIGDFIASVAAESENIPDFVSKLFVKIGSAIADGFAGIIENIKNFNPSEMGGMFGGVVDFFRNAAENLENTFPALDGVLTNGLNTTVENIKNFFSDITGDADNWGDAFSNIFDKIGDNISKLPETIANAFTWLADKAGAGLNWIADQLRSLPGPVGEFFTGLIDNLKLLKQPIDAAIGWITGLFDTIKNLIFPTKNKSVSTPLDLVKNSIDNFKAENIGNRFFGFIDSIKEVLSGKVDNLGEFIKNIPLRLVDMLSTFITYLGDSGLINQVVDIITKVMIGKVLWSLTDFIKGIGNLSNVAAKYLNKKNETAIADKFKEIAIAFGIIAAALFVISQIPKDRVLQCVGIVGACGLIIVAMEFLSGLIAKNLNKKAGDQLVKTAATIGVFAAGLLLMMYTVERLNKFDYMANAKGLIAAGVAITALGLLAALITAKGGKGGKNMIQAAAGIVILVAGLNLLIPVLYDLNAFVQALEGWDAVKLFVAMSALVGFITGLGFALSTIGEHGVGAAIGMLGLAASLGMIADVLIKLSGVDFVSLLVSFGSLYLLIDQLSDITKNTKMLDLIGTSIGIAAFAGSVGILAQALSYLAKNDAASLAAVGASIGVLLYALYKLTDKLEATDILATSAALLLFSGSIGIISIAFNNMANVPWEKIAVGTGAIGALMLALGLLTNKTTSADLATAAISMDAFALAIIGIGYALGELAKLDSAAVLLSAVAIDGVLAALLVLTKFTESADLSTAALAIDAYALAVIGIALALEELAKLDVEKVKECAIAIGGLTAVFGIISLAGENLLYAGAAMDAFALAIIGFAVGIQMLVDIANNMPDFSVFRDAGYNITAGLGEGIISGIGHVLECVVGLGKSILEAILSFFGIHSPSLLMQEEVGQYIPEGIAEGILGGEGTLGESLGGIFEGIKTKIFEFISGFPEWFMTVGLPALQGLLMSLWTWFTTEGLPMLGNLFTTIGDWILNEGLPMLGEALAQFWNWFTTEGLPMLGEFIGGIMSKLGELLTQFWTWFTTEGLPMIGEALGQFWNWATTEGLPKLGEFLLGILSKLGEFAGQFLQWLSTDGVKMLGDALASFWNWVTTEALPKLGEFIIEIFKKIGEIPGKLWNWVTTDGVKMVGEALKGIMDEAGKLGGMVVDWLKGIPGKIGEGISNIWNDICNIGDDIARGIAEGLDNGIEWITNSITGLGESALNGIKDFFGIASPSKLMRDEVGRYIPEGVAEGIREYAGVAELAGSEMGTSAVNGINGALNGANYSFGSPTISPVLDMSTFNTRMDALGNAVLSGQIEAKVTNDEVMNALADRLIEEFKLSSQGISDTISMTDTNLSGQLANINDRYSDYSIVTDDIHEMGKGIDKIADRIDSIKYLDDRLSDIQDFTYSLYLKLCEQGGLNVYMDSGELVGAIAPEMDNRLGQRQNVTSRGDMY